MFIVALSGTIVPAIYTQAQLPESIPNFSNIVNQITKNTAIVGNTIYAPVKLDGRVLFPIGAPAAADATANGMNAKMLQMRVKMYEKNLADIVNSGFDKSQLQITVKPDESNAVIIANDGQKVNQYRLLTITELDSQMWGVSPSNLAGELTEIIRTALITAQAERQPSYLLVHGWISLGIILGIIAINWLLSFLDKKFTAELANHQTRTTDRPEQGKSMESAAMTTMEPVAMMAVMTEEMSDDRRQNLTKFKRNLLMVTRLFVIVGGGAWIAGFFPQTRHFQNFILEQPLIIAIFLGTQSVIKGAHVAIDRLVVKFIATEQMAYQLIRKNLRLTTFGQILKEITAIFLWFLAILLMLTTMQVPIGPVLAGAGIVGFAISFAAQSLIKDVVNGTLILLEDQYAIGDYIAAGSGEGLVEYMNLRITQLRSAEGELITIPNSEITTVRNRSKDWSRINFEIDVAYETDVNQVMQVMQGVAEAMQQDSQWQQQVLEAVNILGVNDLSHQGIKIVIWIKTQPGQQWSVAREYRRRLKLALDAQNIPIGIPQSSLWLKNYPPEMG
ncbi:MAG TPA: mechanosensitive ion channel family protein [Oscillatoriaceae cyanobacterium M33_DOE_052]|nr:mechanosensitive ion channel family protein [Oscillatoriaceae cyanobacterium M33_DOE_052]